MVIAPSHVSPGGRHPFLRAYSAYHLFVAKASKAGGWSFANEAYPLLAPIVREYTSIFNIFPKK
jgi:hypothetical protein